MSRRQESILLPHAVVESDAHFVKSAPHFSDMHLRRARSHAFDVVTLVPPFVAVVSFCASSNARCRRIVSANALSDESVAFAPISDNTSLNIDDLLPTAMTRSGVCSAVVAGVVTGVCSGSFVIATVAVSVVFDDAVDIRNAVDGVRFCVRFAAAAVAAVF